MNPLTATGPKTDASSHALGRERLEQRFGLPKVDGVEALGEPAADAPKEIAVLIPPTPMLIAPLYLSHLARAYADIGNSEDAQRYVDEAMTTVETSKEKWCKADIQVRVTMPGFMIDV